MKIKINISGGKSDFYSHNKLRGVIYKWLNSEHLHGSISLFSYSWIKQDSYFFFSSPFEGIVERIIVGISKDPEMFNGFSVVNWELSKSDINKSDFICTSPIHIKGRNDKFLYFSDANESAKFVLTRKAQMLGCFDSFYLAFEPTGNQKLIEMHDYKIGCFYSKVKILGSERIKQIACEVGIGHKTGCGFGSIY